MSYDYDMCDGVNCPVRDYCLRHTMLENAPRPVWVMQGEYRDGMCEYRI